MISFLDFMSLKTDIFKKYKVKLVRHKDSRKEYRELIKDRDELLKYQMSQSKDVFKGCDYICSFFGLDGSKSLFIGMFKVNGVEQLKTKKFLYDLEEVDGFNDLKDRLVIDWGKATISWHQWADSDKDKEVVELMPEGFLGEFPGTLDFILSHSELKKLNSNLDANKKWFHHLSSINGIYLILDKKTGKQYIGSAYGKNGIWQRWSEYAKTGHGGNELLKKLCGSEEYYYRNFHFSVLQTLPSNLTTSEVVSFENLYKEKLGSRAFGLNMN